MTTWGIAKDKQGLEAWLLVQISSLFSPFMCIFMAYEVCILLLSVCNNVLKWIV